MIGLKRLFEKRRSVNTWLKWNGQDSLPLLDPDRKLCLFFSNKAGCTTLAKWFFFQHDLLAEALAYHPWIHQYRIRVYYQSESYKSALHSIHNNDWHRVKLVRSPYSRAVSSYIHAVRTSYIDPDLSRFLRRAVNPVARFSFEEFVCYAESNGVENADPHFRQQATGPEISGNLIIQQLVQLENIGVGFKQIEKDFGLMYSDLSKLSVSSHHSKSDSTLQEYCGNHQFQQTDKEFSDYQNFYNEDLINRIKSLYHVDFDLYGYDPNEL